MKKRIVFIIVFFSCWAFSQAQQRFHLGYDYNIKNDFGREIIETLNNGFLVFGDKSFGGSPMGFLKTDSVGNVIFNKSYEILNDNAFGGGKWNYGYFAFGAHLDTNEGAANSHFIFLNALGDSLKILDINFAFNDRIHDAVLLPDSSFVVTGFYTDTLATDNKPYISKVDTLGNIFWFKTHNDSSIQEQVKNIAPTQDGGYIIGGQEEQAPGSFQDLFLLKVDSVGDFEWKQNYGGPLSEFRGHVTVCADGGFALVGSLASTNQTPVTSNRGIIKTDSAGNVRWMKDYGTNQYHEVFEVARQLPGGGFICAGSSSRMFNGNQVDDVNLSRLDSVGNLLWSRDFSLYNTDINQYVRDLKVTADSGYVMTGFILNAPGNRNDIFILKTDENGIITGIENGFQEVDIAKRVYPNPTNGAITIPPLPEIEQIQVLGLNGQLVQTIQPNSLGATTFEIGGKSGVYLLNIFLEDGRVSTAKIVKQ